ncbi:MAG TPA: DUF423 domain-containing protein [Candidatus Nitrosotenuis sp.]|jgi:uncharacterized membrane protein YgdD (TMEM256/DUF423 family)|nr:DUF423 domain-containing protein [Candidatus Nitrosotenuis sp.]
MDERHWFALGAVLGALGVAAGAFGAHALREHLPPDRLSVYEVGARYHLVHSLALLAVAFAAWRWPSGLVSAAGWLLLSGILLFSGSLYGLALTGVRLLGAITPLGGLCFLAGWLLLALSAWRR